MQHTDYKNVTLDSGFLYRKHLLNENVTINAVYDRLADTGRIAAYNFDGSVKPHEYWDSDVTKWMESAAYILAQTPNDELQAKVENIIDKFIEHQGEDGYFNLYYMQVEPEGRFTDRKMHELYCLGGFIEASVAYYEATGRDRFLNAVLKYVDYVNKYVIEEKRGAFLTPGHEEIELALIKLYRLTKNKKYLDMAAYFVNTRGTCEEQSIWPGSVTRYGDQSHLPVREQLTAEGHAVRACYLYSAMADLALELNDDTLKTACKRLFDDIIKHKMYITGGIGSTRLCEAFTVPYDLPNERAYAETCAAISLIFFSHRMQCLENNAVYADIIERELYNGFISGLSLSGDEFFYENPLEIDLENYTKYHSSVEGETFAAPQRRKVIDCFCCPPNITRVLPVLGSYIYGFEDGACFINQFAASSVKHDGMEVSQSTDYPCSGKVAVTQKNVKKLYIRIPSWCAEYDIDTDFRIENGYAVVENPADKINIDFKMKPMLIEANPLVKADSGKAAVQYGPVVYCIEAVYNDANLHGLYIGKNLDCTVKYDDTYGLNTITAKGYKKLFNGNLYAPYSETFEDASLSLIPYCCFANRGKSNMIVWLNVR